jgi:hypothetical protein
MAGLRERLTGGVDQIRIEIERDAITEAVKVAPAAAAASSTRCSRSERRSIWMSISRVTVSGRWAATSWSGMVSCHLPSIRFKHLTALEVAEQADDKERIPTGRLADATRELGRETMCRIAVRRYSATADSGALEAKHGRSTMGFELADHAAIGSSLRDLRVANVPRSVDEPDS